MGRRRPIAVSDGLFPSNMALGTLEGIEEERRLFDVALTRARQTLAIYIPSATTTTPPLAGLPATRSSELRSTRWHCILRTVPSTQVLEIKIISCGGMIDLMSEQEAAFLVNSLGLYRNVAK